jgi:hypothetical protein
VCVGVWVSGSLCWWGGVDGCVGVVCLRACVRIWVCVWVGVGVCVGVLVCGCVCVFGCVSLRV